LSLAVGIVAAPLLIATGIAIGSLAGIALLTGLYVIASSLYSMKLKELPLVDVFMLASLYTWRMIAGGVASGHLVSLWLLAFAGSTFLSLAFVKRVAELHALEEQTVQLGRRGYYRNDIRMLPIMGVAASFVSAIILALYVQETSAIEGYQHPAMLWATVPLLLFWQCRLWLSTARGYMNDDPIVYAARDRVSWLVGALLAAAAVMARLNFDLGPSLFLAPQ
jgi:4-hydroxybenzoate polyprenyltransferase